MSVKIAVSEAWVKELTARGMRQRMHAAEQAGGSATTAFQLPMSRAEQALRGPEGLHRRLADATRDALTPGTVTDMRAARKNLLHVDHLTENRAAQMDAMARAHESHLAQSPQAQKSMREIDDLLRDFNAPPTPRAAAPQTPQPSVAAAPVTPPTPSPPSATRRVAPYAAAALGGTALLGTGAYLATRPDEKTAAYHAGYSSALTKLAVSYAWVARGASAGARQRLASPEGIDALLSSARRAGESSADISARSMAGAPMRGRDEKRTLLMQHMLRPLTEDVVHAAGQTMPKGLYPIPPKSRQLASTSARRGPLVDVPATNPMMREILGTANENLAKTLLAQR